MSARTSHKIPNTPTWSRSSVLAWMNSLRITPIHAGICGGEASSSPIPRDPSCGRKSGETTGHRNTRSAYFLGARLKFFMVTVLKPSPTVMGFLSPTPNIKKLYPKGILEKGHKASLHYFFTPPCSMKNNFVPPCVWLTVFRSLLITSTKQKCLFR